MPLVTPAGPASQTAFIPLPTAALPLGKVLGGSKDALSVKSGTRIPIVCLDVDTIKDDVAAKLAISLLGHVLFLKNQIPLPVLQLARMTGTRSTARAVKCRTDLLSSFDMLSSHLNTTFTALSTALALVGRSSCHPPLLHRQARSRVYLAILVGPSMGSSRSKVVFAVDGFETKVWGEREPGKEKEAEVKEILETEEADADEEDTGEEIKEDEDKDPAENEGEDEEGDDGEEEEEDIDQSDGEPSTDDEDPPASPSPSPPYRSHAEEQRALQAAERLLARTLAAVDAEGNGMSAEMAPTQTHILMRAPRRFVHPAWVPRQNMATGMDTMLEEFLDESDAMGIESRPPPVEAKVKKWKKTRVEGVWITDREGLVPSNPEKDSAVKDEWDEMIWWSWEEKIVGFSEW